MSNTTIIAANFLDRGDKTNRWLTRPAIENPTKKDCTLHTGLLIGKAVAKRSPAYEDGFGCGVILESNESTSELAEGFDIAVFKRSGFKQIKFNGEVFCAVDSMEAVKHFKSVLLLPNGEIWADF